jgi:hypothetical protein
MKKTGTFLLACMLTLSMTACGSNNSNESANGAGTEAAGAETTTTEATGAETTTVVAENTEASAAESETAAATDDTPVISVGEEMTTDTCEFSIDSINITNDVMPPKTDGFYTHYQAESGKVYVDFCVAYKNTTSGDVGADEVVSGQLIYADKYTYNGFSIIEEDSRSNFTYANITNIAPLSTEYVHYLFEVPEEVESSNLGIKLEMSIGGSKYNVVVREGSEESTEAAKNAEAKAETKNEKTKGEVAKGETVTTKNSEFNIDYSDITNDVMPPQPANYYSHYEAPSGKVYVDVCFAYTNTSEKDVSADEVISAKLKYANKYDYTGFSMIEEDSRGDFTYSNITNISPLSTEYIHYLFEVPEEVKSSTESVVVTFTVDGNTYTYTVR